MASVPGVIIATQYHPHALFPSTICFLAYPAFLTVNIKEPFSYLAVTFDTAR